MLIMQLEMDMAMTETAVRLACKHNVPVILNPAPARELSDDLLKCVTFLTPNETEAEILTGIPVKSVADAEKAALRLLDRGVRHVIITLAEKGALIVDSSGVTHVPGYPVKPIDTVAAGDSFNGALAVQIVQGASLSEAVQFANAVGALTVLSEGAIPSLPRLDNVHAFIAAYRENN
jgi:ribokinase